MSNKSMEFMVTRTKDNKQLGLSVLIDSLKLGETKGFIEKSAYDKAIEALKKLSKFGEGTHGDRKCSSFHSLDDLQIELNERMSLAQQTLKDLGEL